MVRKPIPKERLHHYVVATGPSKGTDGYVSCREHYKVLGYMVCLHVARGVPPAYVDPATPEMIGAVYCEKCLAVGDDSKLGVENFVLACEICARENRWIYEVKCRQCGTLNRSQTGRPEMLVCTSCGHHAQRTKFDCDCPKCIGRCRIMVFIQHFKKDGTPRKYKTKERCANPAGKDHDVCDPHWEEMRQAMSTLGQTPFERWKPLSDKVN